MTIEMTGIREAFTLLRRDRKYFKGTIGLYLLSLPDCELGQIARTSYFFARYVDDVLDGDREIGTHPLLRVNDLREQIACDNYKKGDRIAALAKFAIARLNERKRDGDDPEANFLKAIDIVIFDYERAEERRVLNFDELEDYYWKAFSPVVNLSLIAVQSQFRANDIRELSICQGIVYSLRDLKEDWAHGIINIPSEVLDRAGLDEYSSYEEVSTNPGVIKWFKEELDYCQLALISLQNKLKESRERITFMMCNVLINSMLKTIDDYEKSHQ